MCNGYAFSDVTANYMVDDNKSLIVSLPDMVLLSMLA
jgi:hypothetical protein